MIPAAPGRGSRSCSKAAATSSADLSGIARSLKNILAPHRGGQGLPRRPDDSTARRARKLGNNLDRDAASLNIDPASKSTAGQGLVGKLLIDEKYGKETGDSLQAARPLASRQSSDRSKRA